MFSIIPLKHRHHFSTFIMLYACIPAVYKNYGCSGIITATIPNSVTTICDRSFTGCSGLTSIDIPNSVTRIGVDAFAKCSNLKEIELPNSLASVDYGAFSNCSSLTSIIIPNSVSSIGEYAFYKCLALTSVSISKSVSTIGDGAFSGCSSIRTIQSEVKTPPTLGNNVFNGLSTNYVKLYVPLGSKDDYAFATGWNVFSNIIEEGTEGMTEVEALKAALNQVKQENKALRNGDFNEDGNIDVKDVTDLVNKVLKK